MQEAIQIPELQKVKVEKQVEKLKRENFLRSYFPWNSPLLLVAKKMDASGKQKFRFVVDYRKLKENTVSVACPLLDITETVGC